MRIRPRRILVAFDLPSSLPRSAGSAADWRCLYGGFTQQERAFAGASGFAEESELEGDIDLRGFLGLEPGVPKGYTNIRMNFKVKTDEENLGRLRKLAEFSPVYNTLVNGVKVDIDIQPR